MKSRSHRANSSLSAGRTLALFAILSLAISAQVIACERHADIRDEPDASLLDRTPQIDAGAIPELDSGLGTDAFPPCGERPLGACQGSNDFPCAFAGWAVGTAESCQEATGCVTNGWLDIIMGADGCVESIGMDQPNDAIIKCLIEEFGYVRCPCQVGEIKHFFGYSNAGTCAE